MNGDRHSDLVIASPTNDVSIWLGNRSDSFTQASGSPISLGTDPNSVVLADFNGDGKLDLAVAQFYSDTVSVLTGDGTGAFTAVSGSPFPIGRDAVDLVVADFNNDGNLDIATADTNQNSAYVLIGDGAGGFTKAPGAPYSVGSEPKTLAAADFTGDGRADLAVANISSDNVSVLKSVPDTTAPTVTCSAPSILSWYETDVSAFCTSNDGYSGLASASDSAFSLPTSVNDGTEPSDAITASRQVCDNAGNCTSGGPFGAYKIDKKPPSVTCNGSRTFALNQSGATVSATVTDGGSGPLASPISSGVDTSKPGSGTAALTGFDQVGHSATANCSYTVYYNFSGFMSPVNNAPVVNTGKARRTYSVRWQLTDATGAFTTSLSAVTSVVMQPTACSTFATDPTDPLETTAAGNGGLSIANNTYLYNWASPTKKGCYTLFVKLNSGQTLPAYFNLF